MGMGLSPDMKKPGAGPGGGGKSGSKSSGRGERIDVAMDRLRAAPSGRHHAPDPDRKRRDLVEQ
jgi:hypothetical protein